VHLATNPLVSEHGIGGHRESAQAYDPLPAIPIALVLSPLTPTGNGMRSHINAGSGPCTEEAGFLGGGSGGEPVLRSGGNRYTGLVVECVEDAA